MRSSGSSLVSARGVVTSAAGPPSVEYEVTEGGGRREEEAKIFRRDRSVTRGATDGSQIAFNPNRERERDAEEERESTRHQRPSFLLRTGYSTSEEIDLPSVGVCARPRSAVWGQQSESARTRRHAYQDFPYVAQSLGRPRLTLDCL